jgi:hypothetical protein
LRRNCLSKYVIEGKKERQVREDGEEKYGNLKMEAPDRIILGTRFGKGYEPVRRHTTQRTTTIYNLDILLTCSEN